MYIQWDGPDHTERDTECALMLHGNMWLLMLRRSRSDKTMINGHLILCFPAVGRSVAGWPELDTHHKMCRLMGLLISSWFEFIVEWSNQECKLLSAKAKIVIVSMQVPVRNSKNVCVKWKAYLAWYQTGGDLIALLKVKSVIAGVCRILNSAHVSEHALAYADSVQSEDASRSFCTRVKTFFLSFHTRTIV